MTHLFENEKATILFNEQIEAIELVWKKKHDAETYKLVFSKILDYVRKYKAKYFLSDIRNEGVVAPETSKWVQTEIMPKAFSIGLKKIAVIMDTDVFKEFYISNIKKAAGDEKMQYFDSEEKAYEWLSK